MEVAKLRRNQAIPAASHDRHSRRKSCAHLRGKRYDLNALPDELKELVRGMQVADAQLRMHEDTLKVLAVGRQSLAMQLNERLKNVTPLPDNG